MKKFAFNVSIPDMIRKLCYRYENPLDYIDVFTSRIYGSGKAVDITLDGEKIQVRSAGTIDDKIFQSARENNVLSVMSIIPPVSDFTDVEITSDGQRIHIDKDRKVDVTSADERDTVLTIRRAADEKSIAAEQKRIMRLYAGSDMQVSLNDALVMPEKENVFKFDQDGFRGEVSYDPSAVGSLNFFYKGRMVSGEEFAKGIVMNLYDHKLNPTMTKSKMITGGRGKKEYMRLKENIPGIMLSFLNSKEMASIRKKSETSYQTILRSALEQHHDNDAIRDYVKNNIKFSDKEGVISDGLTLEYVINHENLCLPSTENALYAMLTGENRNKPATKKDVKPNRPSRIKHYLAAAGITAAIAGGCLMFNAPDKTNAAEPDNEREYEAKEIYKSTKDHRYRSSSRASSDEGNINGGSRKSPVKVPEMSAEEFENHFNSMLSPQSFDSGGGYMLREDLARGLNTGSAANAQLSSDQRGYIAGNMYNTLSLDKEWPKWSKGSQGFYVSPNAFKMPKEIADNVDRNSSLDDKLNAVMNYINGNFEYDTIDPSRSDDYKSFMEATVTEKKAICSSANTYAAMLLYDLGVEDVQFVTGAHDGGPHAWLEVKIDDEWMIFDTTPNTMNPELSDLLQPSGYFFNGGRSGLPSLSDAAKSREYLALLGISALLAAGGYALTKRKPTKRVFYKELDPLFDKYSQECLEMRDMLGVNAVMPVEGDAFSYNNGTKTLSVPVEKIEKYDPMSLALLAVPHMGLSPKDSLSRYDRIVDRNRR